MSKNGFKKITLANGLRILLIPRPQSLAASVLILVEAGSEYETKKINGLSHFLEHMMFKGTVNRPKPGMIAQELAALGAQSNAFTSQEYTGYWAKAESHKVHKIFDIVSDLYLNPIFNQEEIEKERGVIIEEINMYEDTPMRRVQEFFTTLLYGDQPAGWDIAGKKEVIRKVSRNDFIKYRGERYVSSKTVVVVAGNFDIDKVKKQINETFGGLKRKRASAKPKTHEKQSTPKLLLKFKDSDQSHLVLGVRAFNIFDKRRYAAQLLADVLGGGMSSRLFTKVRDELGAAYYVNAGMDLFLDHGYMAVAAGVDHAKIEKVITAILDELRKVRDDLVPDKEFQKCKDHLIGNLILNLETSDEMAGFYGEQEILTGKITSPKRLIDKVNAVRPEEVRSIARAILRNESLNLAVIGPYKGNKAVSFKRLLTL